MDTYIYKRCKDFTIDKISSDFSYTKRDIVKCLADTAKILSMPQKEVEETIVSQIKQIEDECILSKSITLQDYQLRVVRHMLTNRGIVVAFDVGKGKTLTAIASAVCLVRQAQFFQKKVNVYIITPTSLQDNFKKEMRKFGVDPDNSNFYFYTIVGFVNAQRKGSVDTKNALMIIDEAHNLRKDYRHEFPDFAIKGVDEDARAPLYIKCASEAWKVILLTATPVYNLPHDVVNLVAMARGEAEPLFKDEFQTTLSDPEAFKRYFGCIFAFEKAKTSDFPTRRDHMVAIRMNKDYYREYMNLEDIIKGRKKMKGDEKMLNTFMVKLRKATNDLKPCMKCDEVLALLKDGKKAIIYSQFITSGINLVKDRLYVNKIPFREITGKTNKRDRQTIVQEINDPNGPNVLLITGAGGEGLDLKGIRKVILLEKGWTVSAEEQVIGRAVRYKSHEHLPPEERYVDVYHLVMIKPQEDENYLMNKTFDSPVDKNVIMSADLYLFKRSRYKEIKANEFRKKLEAVALGSAQGAGDCPEFMYSKMDALYPVRDIADIIKLMD